MDLPSLFPLTRSALRDLSLTFALAVVLAFPNAAAAQGFQWMHLMGPGVGWIASSTSVFWTTNDGTQWRNITPPKPVPSEKITSVFFLDDFRGWVLLSHYEEPQPRFDLAYTVDAGSTWSVTRLKIPVDPKDATVLDQGYIQFTDTGHGWMNLSLQSGTASHLGQLFRTVDGGKTWTLSNTPGSSGELLFLDEQNGWMLSPERAELWETHDGASTWSRVLLKAPAQLRRAEVATYQLPLFIDKKQGVLAVGFSPMPAVADAASLGTQMTLFNTTNSGNNWRFDRVLKHFSAEMSDLVATIMDSIAVTAYRTGDNLVIEQIQLNSSKNSTVSANIGFPGGVLGINFADHRHGWVLTSTMNCSVTFQACTQLLSSEDGGGS